MPESQRADSRRQWLHFLFIMLHRILAFLAVLSIASAFRKPFGSTPRALSLRANKIDGITVEGDLQPLSNNLLIKVKDAAIATTGGLFIPDNAKERPTEGTVVAAGPGRVHPDTALLLDIATKVGDCVIYGKYDGTELKYNDVNHQMIKDDDVLLIYNGKEATFENVRCVKDQVMVKLPPKEEANLSGLIINTPGGSDKRPDTGVVAKVGPGRQAGNGKYLPIQVQPGDGVRFRDFAGSVVKIEGQEYVVIRAYDILAKW
jgi:chaperonin GroES